jgi:hypothetical protein
VDPGSSVLTLKRVVAFGCGGGLERDEEWRMSPPEMWMVVVAGG